MTHFFPLGKLPPEQLGALLNKHTFSLPGDRVLVYPEVGEDATVIDMGERWLVAKTDPITFASDEIGWYAVNVNANDIAAAGGEPRWFLSTLLLPQSKTDIDLVDRIMAQIAAACRALNIVPCGGHTEITYGIDRPIVVGRHARRDQTRAPDSQQWRASWRRDFADQRGSDRRNGASLPTKRNET